MDTLLPLVLGSIKGLVLLSFTAGITLALKHRAARVRAVVWGTAIAGCLVIPLVAPLLPTWTFPVRQRWSASRLRPNPRLGWYDPGIHPGR